ncbi:MAG: MFS transporter [Chthoniobacterales bacterium]
MQLETQIRAASVRSSAPQAALSILFAISVSHLLNDAIQALIPAVYPLLKSKLQLSFSQVGLITLAFQLTASLLQPFLGLYTDRHPKPYSLACGMGASLLGLVLLSWAESFLAVVLAAALVGLGSSVFHPEASRVARLASGGRYGFAQSFFQVGGNAGSALGPLLAALIVVPRGQSAILWFCLAALTGILVLSRVGRWYQADLVRTRRGAQSPNASVRLPRARVSYALAILVALLFSKYFYLASLSSYYTFYLIAKFHLSVRDSQFYLFVFLAAAAIGTLIGGPIGDRFGRKNLIWLSILGVAPFPLILPYATLFWTGALSVAIGLILASAFSAILVYGQELMPGNVGGVAGLFFGLAFGMGGIGSAVLGYTADRTGIEHVFHVCSFLPLIGLLAVFLPDIPAAKASTL